MNELRIKAVEMPNRNATPAAFGWDFQINAGIVIMLDFIQEAEEIKIEGTKEDIEIVLKGGKRVFAQAKSTMNPANSSNAIRDLTKALKTLSEANCADCVQRLILVTNRADPFKDEKTRRFFSNARSNYEFKTLPIACKQRIIDICKQNQFVFPTDKFSVLSIFFEGDGDMRYQTIKERVSEFLVEIDPFFQGFGKRTLANWQLRFGQNASQNDRNRTIRKSDMIWPLIVWLCEARDVSWTNSLDTADSDEIEDRFSSVINEQSERFDLVAKVMTAYGQFKKEHPDYTGDRIEKDFIEDRTNQFSTDFDFTGLEPQIANAVLRFTIAKILNGQRKIAKVKEAVGL